MTTFRRGWAAVSAVVVMAMAACSPPPEPAPSPSVTPRVGPSSATAPAPTPEATARAAARPEQESKPAPEQESKPAPKEEPKPAPKSKSSASKKAKTGTSLGSCPVFPKDNPWNQDISALPVHEKSGAWVASIGKDLTLHPDFGTFWDGDAIGIPYVTHGGVDKVKVTFDYASESDKGPYPIPRDAPIEAGGDRHVIVVDTSTCTLYELFDARPVSGGKSWKAGSGAIFNLKSNKLRPAGWTSADAAGLPIFPGLVRYDEVKAGSINHALRFTVSKSQAAYMSPARHFASSSTNANLPPMGARFRLKASYSCATYSKEVQVICAALKKYGMIVADNGSNWYVSGTHDTRWNDAHLNDLKKIPGSAFEAVDTGAKIVTK